MSIALLGRDDSTSLAIHRVMDGTGTSVSEYRAPFDIAARKMLSRAVINLALYDLINKRRNTELVAARRSSAKHFLIDREASALRDMYCSMADIDTDNLEDKAEQYVCMS